MTSSVDPRTGGVAESIRTRGVKLLDLGHSVEVASLNAPGCDFARDYPLPLHLLGPGRTAWQYSARLEPWIRANAKRFDAVVIDGLWQHYGLATRAALKGTGVPYFVFPHGMLDPWFKRTYPLKHVKKWLVWPWADYRVLRDAKAVLFTCQEERELAAQSFWLYSVKPMVVPFGCSAPPDDADAMREEFLQLQPQLRGKKVLLFLGRIHPKKGCDLLIEAFARAVPNNPEIQLLMAGPGASATIHKLKKRATELGIADNVHWPGMLAGRKKWGAFFASEAFALPSHQENFGIAVAEALACGLPVLISNKVNIWREIQEGQAGFVDSDDIAGTECIITQWLRSPLSAAQMSQFAKATYIRNFAVDAMAHGLVNALRTAS